MALAKERSIRAHESFIMNSVDHLSPQSQYSSPDEFEQDKSPSYGGGGGGPPMRAANSHHHHPEDGHDSVINFTTFMASSDQPLLSFDPKEELYNMDHHHHQSNYPRFNDPDHYSCFQTAASDDNSYGWLYSDSTVTTDTSFEESRATKDSSTLNKRPMMGESNQPVKKQCSNSSNSATNSKKPKVQKPSASKDPQSIAAKNRRERISERLKVLQELVPNGSKVDLVTMLEKAISYVKFLQLQVKVLATDEFWPVQGGKAPDISQVREAIDAILSSSQREKNSRPN